MALLDLVLRCGRRLELDLSPAALHIDYGLRGADSERDRHIVAAGCAAHAVPLHVVAAADVRGPGLQQRAREVRYAAARALSAEHQYAPVVTAHNRDDQAETVLYRLLKYPSPASLQGMALAGDGIARPLLCLGADEVREYCRTRGIDFGEDVSNARPVYARNRLRLEVLPALQRINPRAAEALAEAAAMARDQQILLDGLAEQAWQRVAVSQPADPAGGAATLPALDLVALAAEPPALRIAVVRRLLQAALGSGRLLERRPAAAVAALAARQGGGRVSLPDGLEAVRERELLWLRRRRAAHACGPVSAALNEGDVVELAFCDAAFTIRLLSGAQVQPSATEAWIGLHRSEVTVALRHPRPGERFQPFGMHGSTTVLQFLADQKVPPSERERALVIEVDGTLAWVRGRVAQPYRVSQSTKLTLHVRKEER